jgi:hypothetical protein
MTFETDGFVTILAYETGCADSGAAGDGLDVRAARLLERTRHRDRHFRRSVMADAAMSIMLALFLAELRDIQITPATLALINLLEDCECQAVIDSLVQAGLADVTGDNSDRRTVGLTALGSARMRSYVSDFQEF